MRRVAVMGSLIDGLFPKSNLKKNRNRCSTFDSNGTGVGAIFVEATPTTKRS